MNRCCCGSPKVFGYCALAIGLAVLFLGVGGFVVWVEVGR